MANGGNSGELDRLQEQVDAARSELAGVAGAVSGLTQLLTDFVRRSSSDHQDDRWHARLGSLETRLEMLETAIRTEVERMRATAGAVDALADEFRSTVGGTRNLVDLAADVSDRLGDLQSLEREVRGAAQDIATVVESQLQDDKADRRARDNALIEQFSTGLSDRASRLEATVTERVERVESTMSETVAEMRGAVSTGVERVQVGVDQRIGQITERLEGLVEVAFEQAAERARLDSIERIVGEAASAVNDLGRRFDAVARAASELPGMEERLSTEMRDATAWGEVLGRLSAQVGGVHGRLDETTTMQQVLVESIVSVARDLQGLRADLDTSSEANLRTMGEALIELSTDFRTLAHQVQESGAGLEQFSEVKEILAQVRSHQPQVTVRLDQLAADLAELRSASTDDAFAELHQRMDGLVTAMRNVVTSQPDPGPQLELVAEALNDLRASAPNYTEQFEQLRSAIDRLPTSAPEYPDYSERLDQVLGEIAATRAAIPEASGDAERVSYLLDQQASALIDLQAAQTQTGDRLERVADAIAELRATPAPVPHVDVDLEPLVTRVEALATELDAFRSTQPAIDSAIERVATVLNDQTSALAQLQATQPAVASRLENLAGEINSLATRPDETTAMTEALGRLAAEVAGLRSTDSGLGEALAPLSTRLDTMVSTLERMAQQPEVRPALEQLASALEAVRDDVAQNRSELATLLDGRLSALTEVADRLHTSSPDTAVRLDQVLAELADLRSRAPDLPATMAPLIAHLSQLGDSIGDLHAMPAALEAVSTELADLRQAQINPDAINSFAAERLDRVIAEIVALRADRPDTDASASAIAEMTAAIDTRLASLTQHLTPLGAQLNSIDARAEATRDSVGQVGEALARTSAQLEEAVAGITALRDEPDRSTEALTPVVDRLAILLDGLSAMHGDVTALADSISTIRADRAQLVQMSADGRAQLDELAEAIAALPTSSPDYGDRFAETNERIDQVAATLADAVARAEAAEPVIPPPPPDYGPSLAEINRRLEGLAVALDAAAAAANEPAPTTDYLPNFDDTTDRLDRIAAAIAEVRTSRPDFTSSFAALSELMVALQAGVTGVHNRMDSIDELVRQADTDDASNDAAAAMASLHTRLDDLTERASTTQEHVASILERLADNERPDVVAELTRRVDEVAADVASTRDVARSIEATLAAPSPEADEDDDRTKELSDQVATLASDVKSAVRATVGLGADVTAMRSDLNNLSASLAEPREAEPVRDEDAHAALARIDTSVTDLRQAIASLDPSASISSVLEAITALGARDTDEPLRAVDGVLRELRSDLQATRAELQAVGRAVEDLEVEVSQPAQEPDFEASAALVATAAAAMSRLEGRIENEFDGIGRHMEAVGTLLAQTIDAIHRIESQVVGVQPVTEHMRTAANTVLESMRANVRQRANRRTGPPQELGAGD